MMYSHKKRDNDDFFSDRGERDVFSVVHGYRVERGFPYFLRQGLRLTKSWRKDTPPPPPVASTTDDDDGDVTVMV